MSTELRWLRQWHWDQFQRWTRLEVKWAGAKLRVDRAKAAQYRRNASVHMRAVQALNGLFPIGDGVKS